MKLSTNAETTRSNSPVRAGIAVALPVTASIGRSPAPCLAAARYASEGSTPRTRAGCSLSGSSAPAPRFHIRRRTTLQGVTPAAATAGTAAQPVGSSVDVRLVCLITGSRVRTVTHRRDLLSATRPAGMPGCLTRPGSTRHGMPTDDGRVEARCRCAAEQCQRFERTTEDQ